MDKIKNKISLIQEDRRFLYVQARDDKQKSMQLEKRVEELEADLQEHKDRVTRLEADLKEAKLENLRLRSYGGGLDV